MPIRRYNRGANVASRSFYSRNRRIMQQRPIDPVMGPVRIFTNAQITPKHVTNPRVTRIVRFTIQFNATFSSFDLTYASLAAQDALDYLGASTTVRYSQLRVLNVKGYLNTFPSTLAIPAIGLTMTDAASGVQFVSEPSNGASIAAVGYMYPFSVRTAIAAASSVVVLTTIATDVVVPASGNVNATIDVAVEFQ